MSASMYTSAGRTFLVLSPRITEKRERSLLDLWEERAIILTRLGESSPPLTAFFRRDSVSKRGAVMKTFLFASLVFLSTAAFADVWTEDYASAVRQAKAEKKELLLFFTGSDWCPWCKKLTGEILSTSYFEREAPKKFVLVKLDFPHDIEQSDELKAQNKDLRKKFKVRGFPTLILADSAEKPYITNGYREQTPEIYLSWLIQSKVFQKLDAFIGAKEYEAALTYIEQLTTKGDLLPDLRQRAFFARAQILDLTGKPKSEIIDALEESVAADPNTSQADAIREIIEQLKNKK